MDPESDGAQPPGASDDKEPGVMAVVPVIAKEKGASYYKWKKKKERTG